MSSVEKILRLGYFASVSAFYGHIIFHITIAFFGYAYYGVPHADHPIIFLDVFMIFGFVGQLVFGLLLWKYNKKLSKIALWIWILTALFAIPSMVTVC